MASPPDLIHPVRRTGVDLASLLRDMRDLLLTIHILSAAAWIGGALYATISLPRHAANAGVAKTLAVDQWLGPRFFGTAVGLLLLSGIGLVVDSEVFGWGDAFVLIGIGVIVISSALEGAVFSPAMKKAAESEDELSDSTRRTIRWGLAVNGVLFVLAVWVMVTKLGV